MQFMTNPLHGATNAADSEVESLKAQGWTISTPEQWLAGKFQPVEATTERKKPGRKPKAAE